MSVDAEQLISEVERRPIIWDTSHDDYKNKQKKTSAWLEICLTLVEDFDVKSEVQRKVILQDVASKWRSLRDNYVRSVRKQAEKTKPGAKKMKLYIFSGQLSFLKKNRAPSPVEETNIEENSEEISHFTITKEEQDNTEASDNSESHEVTAATTPPISVGNTVPRAKRKRLDVERTMLNFMARKNALEEDDNLAFFYSLLPLVRQLNMEQKFAFRIQTMKLLQNLQNTTNSQRSPQFEGYFESEVVDGDDRKFH